MMIGTEPVSPVKAEDETPVAVADDVSRVSMLCLAHVRGGLDPRRQRDFLHFARVVVGRAWSFASDAISSGLSVRSKINV